MSLQAQGEWFICQLLIFGCCDFIARGVAAQSVVGKPPSHGLLLAYALARFALIGLLAGCVYGLPPSALFGDATLCVFVGLLGGTGGHLSTLVFMHGHREVSMEDKEAAGFVLVACLHLGIVAGSNAALLFEASQ